ncbi:hypothetical protein [Kitasatospora sp. DSM 101779]|uniref:hypothetical protein n=1 Tax=Kitasatospora sp. DSM 101779 TaxID=2853165 RepID=UPI0021D9491A|nr:hypothetical protein [Kitasatospora sp. DSM 101779]MCU7827015.1 hypothetical protein [Kitasatospora sp. DSM 101779]
MDAPVLAYHGAEDLWGRRGTAQDDRILTQATGEGIHGQDLVLRWCADVDHHAAEGGDEWHVCGPILHPFGLPVTPAGPAPGSHAWPAGGAGPDE